LIVFIEKKIKTHPIFALSLFVNRQAVF